MPFIITGCQRSGTLSIANLFAMEHECYFQPDKIDEVDLEEKTFNEVSWLAAPYLKKLKNKNNILHLIRNPYDVIASLLGMKFWIDCDHRPYREFIFHHLPELRSISDLLELSAQYYIKWNGMVAKGTGKVVPRLRIEDIKNCRVYNSRPHLVSLPGRILEHKELGELACEYGYAATNSG